MSKANAISFREIDKSNQLSWTDTWINMTNQLINARSSGDHLSLIHVLAAAEALTEPWRDQIFFSQHEELMKLTTESFERFTAEQWQDYDLTRRLEMQFGLLARLTRQEQRVSESCEDSEIIKLIVRNLRKGTGQNCFFTGKQGSGKSWATLKLGYEVSKYMNVPFDVKTHVVYSPIQFLELYNNEKLCPAGSTIIFDDTGVSFGSRDFQARMNKLFAKVTQTIRYKGLLCLFSSPSFNFLDSQARTIMHYHFITTRLDRTAKVCYVDPREFDLHQISGDEIRSHPRFEIGAYLVKVTEVRFRPPPEEITKQYEKQTKAFKDELARKTLEELKQLDIDPDEDDGITSEEMMQKTFNELREKGYAVLKAANEIGIDKNKATVLNEEYKKIKAKELRERLFGKKKEEVKE